MKLSYTSRKWLKKPLTVKTLIRRLGFTMLATLNEDNWVVRRRGEKGPSFHVLHRSWGEGDSISKYKLYFVKE